MWYSNHLTFRFSTCRSAGVPWKFRRYGGYSQSGACLYSNFSPFGMRQCSSVSSKVLMTSCQILRFVCGEFEDKSTLEEDEQGQLGNIESTAPRRKDINAYNSR